MKTFARYLAYILAGAFASFIAASVLFDNFFAIKLNPAPLEMLTLVALAVPTYLIGPIAGFVLAMVETRRRKRKRVRASEDSENPYPPI
jgi:hypothetical protein